MKKAFCILTLTLFTVAYSFAQVGIGTTTPNPKAALDMKSTDKGVLFPMMTSAQRDAIVNPPHGLHVFNKSERCLNVYDSAFASWNCYCALDTCKVIFIRLARDTFYEIDFSTYTRLSPTVRKFVLLIEPGVRTFQIDFSRTPATNTYKIKIVNRGNIFGPGGDGGDGSAGDLNQCNIPARGGFPGFPAIITRSGIDLLIENYGVIAGGGGGGGGGGRPNSSGYGGGGGGGNSAFRGSGGGPTITSQFGCSRGTPVAQSGADGTINTGGIGGLGASGGGNGGKGGNPGQAGQPGTGIAAGPGGAVGKAVNSLIFTGLPMGTTIITNIAGGQVFGVVD